MKTKFLENKVFYDGSQLRSLYNYLEHGLLGDSIISFIGGCDVSLDHMVDGEDKRVKAAIKSQEMLHFIIEIFDEKLSTAVSLQRLFASIVKDCVEHTMKPSQENRLRREGDDLYLGTKKLSISIATKSPVSILIHFAVNITNEGTPVETLCLNDLSIDSKSFAQKTMELFKEEWLTIREATQKVHWVK